MNRFVNLKSCVLAMVFAGMAHMNSALACAACYGAHTDSRLAAGMNWGIMALLAVILTMLVLISCFFIFLAKRAAATAALNPPTAPDISAATLKA